MLKNTWLLIPILSFGISGIISAGESVAVDSNIKQYVKVGGVSGNLNSIGSDTMNNLMTYWAEGFNKAYPNVKIQIEGKGSTTAPPSLISGTSQLGPMSRAMKPTEIDAFEKKYGYKPTEIKTALDALAVYVNKDNQIKGLSLPQVDAIFQTPERAVPKRISKHGENSV